MKHARIGIAILAGAALTLAVPGQIPAVIAPRQAEPLPASAARPSAWLALTDHTERKSRRAFAACDADADDRLSILEAARAIDGVDPSSLEVFRRLDADSDGYLAWPEFDVRYREVVERGVALRIRPARALDVLGVKGPVPADPMAAKVAELEGLLDRNRDGVITTDEAARLPAELLLPPELPADGTLLDADRSGTISSAELAPLAQLLRQRPATVAPEGPLPDGFRGADRSADGVLTAAELATVLEQLDAPLARWAEQVVRDADRSGNETLGPVEIREAWRVR